MTSTATELAHAPETQTSLLTTASGSYPLELRLADSFLSRFRGLMLTAPLRPTQGLLITRCPSVHGALMRYPIDVVYLDRQGHVTKCVPGLRPWRVSVGSAGRDADGRRFQRAAHTLELAAGAIASMSIQPGDRLTHPYFTRRQTSSAHDTMPTRERGSAMIEFTVVGPVITLLGLAILQYGMLFFAKTQINYAAFMAAREGSTANANMNTIFAAYVRALIPLYGGGQSSAELADSLTKATADVGNNGSDNVDIEMLNPTKESFADWNDPALQASLHTGGKRVIPNAGQPFKPTTVGPTSGETVQDANLIKLRITHGYLPKVPLVKNLYTTYLKWADPHTSAFYTQLVAAGRIPVVTHVTLHMQSDAIEPDTPTSSPGPGNGGNPVDPGPPATTTNPPPPCVDISCDPPDPAPPSCNPALTPTTCNPTTCTPSANMCCLP